jgi:pyrimidine-specific ribonucleoside hydrolase
MIRAITTVAGNVGADTTYLNALRACDFLDVSDIPVGRADTSSQPSTTGDASHIHGTDGLGDASRHLPIRTMPKKVLSSRHLIKKVIKKHPETQILTFGPLTNIATYLFENSEKKSFHMPIRIISMG